MIDRSRGRGTGVFGGVSVVLAKGEACFCGQVFLFFGARKRSVRTLAIHDHLTATWYTYRAGFLLGLCRSYYAP